MFIIFRELLILYSQTIRDLDLCYLYVIIVGSKQYKNVRKFKTTIHSFF